MRIPGPNPTTPLPPAQPTRSHGTSFAAANDANLDPSVAPDKQQAVFRDLRPDPASSQRAYQVDYLINPQLGGNDHLENLWPEPYHATVWNARVKDELETRLNAMVCSGQIDLQSAQQDLSTDWIAAYKKYFHTQRPVRNVAELDPLQRPPPRGPRSKAKGCRPFPKN